MDQKLTNSFSSFLTNLLVLLLLGGILQMSGCESCKDTSDGVVCAGKLVGLTYKELKDGFNKGNK